jgi:hypothetical protein
MWGYLSDRKTAEMRSMNLNTSSNQTSRIGMRDQIHSRRREITDLKKAAGRLGMSGEDLPKSVMDRAVDTVSFLETRLEKAENDEFGTKMSAGERVASEGVSKYAYSTRAETTQRRVNDAKSLLMGIDNSRRDSEAATGQVSGDSGTKWLTRMGNSFKDGPAGSPWNLPAYRAEGQVGRKDGVDFVGATVHMGSDHSQWVGLVADQESGREILLNHPSYSPATVGYEYTSDGQLLTYNEQEVRDMPMTNVLGPDFSPKNS